MRGITVPSFIIRIFHEFAGGAALRWPRGAASTALSVEPHAKPDGYKLISAVALTGVRLSPDFYRHLTFGLVPPPGPKHFTYPAKYLDELA